MRKMPTGPVPGALLAVAAALVVSLAVCACRPASAGGKRPFAGHRLELFVGSASKPPTEEAAALFEKRTGAKLELHFGGSGAMLSQMKLSGRGDLYFPGSSDYMELAKRERLVDPKTDRIVVYLIPAINVPRGNPKRIRGLADLARPGMRIGIGRPDSVCVGLYAVETMRRAKLDARIRPNVVTQAESCEKTAQIVALGLVDAVLGWDVFAHWDPQRIQTIPLPKSQVPRIGYIPIAVSAFCRERKLAEAFIAFLQGPDAKKLYRKWGYLTAEKDARRFALPKTPVGGEWALPKGWR